MVDGLVPGRTANQTGIQMRAERSSTKKVQQERIHFETEKDLIEQPLGLDEGLHIHGFARAFPARKIPHVPMAVEVLFRWMRSQRTAGLPA